jgi:hypothetical protein
MTLTVPEMVIAVTCLIWLIRLEAKVIFQGKDHVELKETVKAKDKLLWEKFDIMRADIARILEIVFEMKGKISNEKDI